MPSEVTLVLRFEESPPEQDLRQQIEYEWGCDVVTYEEEEV